MIEFYLVIWTFASIVALPGYIATAYKPDILTISDLLLFIICLPASILFIIIFIIVKFIMHLNTIIIYKKEE